MKAVVGALLLLIPGVCLAQTPPFTGTIFLEPDIIRSTDRSAFVALEYTGQDSRRMFDRRAATFVQVNAYLFRAGFDDGLTAEVQVNPEFGSQAAAQREAEKYARAIGRIPTQLRTDMATVWIHKGLKPFGGGNNNVLIHTGQAEIYERDGILEETLVHEASHTSLDAHHAGAVGWRRAQQRDGSFISTYARDNPVREDIAETFLLYLAARHRSNRISRSLLGTIERTVPNRLAYFDDQRLLLYPITRSRAPR
ncbi:MAG: hypothetical protein GKS06_14460 [Acidobacteria bacterium]|nr:hypothetical protein [Acidobacteriota bacterium]